MDALHACCCGVNVHKKMVVACLMRQAETGAVHNETRTSSTVTADLLAMSG